MFAELRLGSDQQKLDLGCKHVLLCLTHALYDIALRWTERSPHADCSSTTICIKHLERMASAAVATPHSALGGAGGPNDRKRFP